MTKKQNVIFLNGLSCDDGAAMPFIKQLQSGLGASCEIHMPNLAAMDRSSTEAALQCITKQFRGLEDPVVLGFSLGGLWGIYLARQGFTDKVIAISPALPSNFTQVDLMRFGLFWKQLISNRPFRFTEEIARKFLMPTASESMIAYVSQHFRNEPASLLREYALRNDFLYLSRSALNHLRTNVKGLIFSGVMDRICDFEDQVKLSEMLSWKQVKLEGGHTPQYEVDGEKFLQMLQNYMMMIRENSLPASVSHDLKFAS